jgi:hypothetical protein
VIQSHLCRWFTNTPEQRELQPFQDLTLAHIGEFPLLKHPPSAALLNSPILQNTLAGKKWTKILAEWRLSGLYTQWIVTNATIKRSSNALTFESHPSCKSDDPLFRGIDEWHCESHGGCYQERTNFRHFLYQAHGFHNDTKSSRFRFGPSPSWLISGSATVLNHFGLGKGIPCSS